MMNRIGPTFWDEIATVGLMGKPFVIDTVTGEVKNSELSEEDNALLLQTIEAHDPSKHNSDVPDNPTLGDWRVALALWQTTDASGNPVSWLNFLTTNVNNLVASGNPMGQVITQRFEYSNNVKRAELLQLKDFFGFTAEQIDESLYRANQVALGDLSGVWPLVEK